MNLRRVVHLLSGARKALGRGLPAAPPRVTKKADAVERAEALDPIGLLVDGPPGTAGCPSISHPTISDFALTESIVQLG